MKRINLISESDMFRADMFSVCDFYGKDTIALSVTENELVKTSHLIMPYDKELKQLPYIQGQISGIEHPSYKGFYCPTSFFIVTETGTVGFESIAHVSRCNVKETADEYIVTISLETDESTKGKVFEAHKQSNYTIQHILNENLCANVAKTKVPTPDIVKKLEETPFLNISVSRGLTAVPVSLDTSSKFYVIGQKTCYTPMLPNEGLSVGSPLYCFKTKATFEIATIKHIAHDVYGNFYAVAQTAYVYPQDAKEIKQKYPSFYNKHCHSEAELVYREFIGKPETVSYIPEQCKMGESVMYQPLEIKGDNFGVTKDSFQFTVDSKCKFDDFQQPQGDLLRIGVGYTVGTLISANGKFKIMLYKCMGVVKYKNRLYVKFEYDDESNLFTDFNSNGDIKFVKYHNENAYRTVECLLFRELIKPVVASGEMAERVLRGKEKVK